jgi:two-component system, OmpR family, sensor histidine kinase PhoQ
VLNSLYLRLNFTAILVLLIFLAVMGIVIDNAFTESTRLAMRERMLGQIYQLLTASDLDNDGQLIMPLPTNLPYPQLALPDSGLYAFVAMNGSDQLLWRSPSLHKRKVPKPFDLKVGEKQWSELRMEDGNNYYLLGFGFQRTFKTGIYSYNFYLMTELMPLYKQISLYRHRLWGGLASALVLLLATQILVLRWGLKPLRNVSQELTAIESGESKQINGHYPREIRVLTDKINNLLVQERARQTRYRNALADLSHSLKTPLAVLLGGLDQPETLTETVQEQSLRMMLIVERQLQRAGAANDTSSLPQVRLFTVTERVIASLSKVYRSKNVNVSNHIIPDLQCRFNEADLIEIIGNLLDNAFKWCDKKIEIQGYKDGQQLILRVLDDGPGVSSEHTQHILQRGGRVDESTPGYGIGLSVVTEIVEAYEGRLSIEKSPLGGAALVVEFYR